ncbi:pyridoxamine 5'-phosphate oxidase family protein [Streptomyces virginiae]|uniref:pyridoxamine 5'-phosphate oxidase family protein n=1 Tax=Streptomyces virginiae TaxID=1961 RepID=UPI002DBE8BAE|nr:pyridoxamine 5'-phosphate oxidase family protein [Streptomyces sp. CMAA1738]MEC4570170.1 pyridoxamine 5'-phosphate oxidase family protein [Streptomyces sp. CMAA1738]
MRELDRSEALGLLASVSLGRIVFTEHALPAVRPVNHLVDGDDIVIRIHEVGALAALAAPVGGPGVVVAYEADAIDPDTHLGWSVVVTGYARSGCRAEDDERYAALLHPGAGPPRTCTVRIRPDLVTGFRLDTAAPRIIPICG